MGHALTLGQPQENTLLMLQEVANEKDEYTSGVERFLNGPFDILMGCVIAANAVLLFAQLQVEGMRIGVRLGVESGSDSGGSDGDDAADVVFHSLQLFFIVTFFLEMVFRIAVMRSKYFMDTSNLFDMIIVIGTSVEAALVPLRANIGVNLSFARLVRLVRLVKVFRIFRTLKLVGPLRVLVRTVASSISALCWSMTLVALFMYMSAIALCQMLSSYLHKNTKNTNNLDALERETAIWIYKKYGTSLRAFYTMFEVTFSGGWPAYVWPLVDKVSAWYGVFFAFYVAGVVFALIRIITALFLKETLQAAANDTDMMIRLKMCEKAKCARKLEELFAAIDSTGDGVIGVDEFVSFLGHSEVKAYFSILELDVQEAASMFTLLDDGDGMIRHDEFIRSVINLKGQARSQDVVMMQHECRRIGQRVEAIATQMENYFATRKTL